MTSYQEEKEKILKRLIADIDDAMEHAGTPFNRDPSKKVQKKLAEASRALDELIRTMVIGEDAKGAEYDGGEMIDCPECDYCVHDEAPHCACDVQNRLRASQRQVMEKGEDDELQS